MSSFFNYLRLRIWLWLHRHEYVVEDHGSYVTYERREINFAHRYYKLSKSQYTTIRDIHSAAKFKAGQVLRVTVNHDYLHTVRIRNISFRFIDSFSLEFLREDAEYPGFEIQSHQDFVDLLREFYPDTDYTLETEVCVLHLEVARK